MTSDPADSAFLAEVPFFKLLDDAERAELAPHLETVRLAAGDTLFRYGEPGDCLYIVRSGEAEVSLRDDTGQKIVLERATRGTVLGELSLLDGGPRTATVTATQDLETLRLDRADLDTYLRAHPAAALDLLAAMGRRLRFTDDRLRHTASRNVNVEIQDNRTPVQKIADWIAEFSGSIPFLTIHVVIFALWILLNVPGVPGAPLFDPFPFGLLTMVVSLEAIILSVFVLLSQQRQAAKDRIRGDVEYEVNLKAELEVAHLHEKVDEISARTAEILEGQRKPSRRP